MVMAEEESGPDGFGRVVQNMAAILYTNDGLLASTSSDCLQGEFNEPTDFFDRVGLQKDVKKTTGMI